jgi:predicted nucleotidyltransferase
MISTARLPVAVARERAAHAARLLAADPRVRLVYLFGSAADPDRPADLGVRDIDLAVLTDPPLSGRELLDLHADLTLELGDCLDLVSLNRDAPLLQHEVTQAGRCLYAAEPGVEEDFRARVHLRWLDWKYFLDIQWRNSGERLEERRRGLAG